jgi:adenosylhomocysteine nucleosidase
MNPASGPTEGRWSDHRPPVGRVALVSAMAEEVAVLRSRLTEARPRRLGDREVVGGRLDDTPVVLLVTGDGARNARQGLSLLLAASEGEWTISRLIVVGIAGALSPHLRPGALVVAERVVHADPRPGVGAHGAGGGGGWPGLWSDSAWVAHVARCARAEPAVVVTAGRIADSVAEKQRLRDLASEAGTATAAAVVDLESAIHAELAAEAGIPWLVLRAVSDTASEALPELLNRARDDGGSVRRGQVLRGLLGNPRALPRLLALRSRLGRCAEVLSQAISREVLAGPPPEGMDIELGTASEGA